MNSTTKTILILLVLALFVVIYPLKINDGMKDFRVDYTAGQRLSKAEQIYRAEDGLYRYKYLPAAAILEAPFSFLPFEAAKLVFYALTVACTFGVLWMSCNLLPLSTEAGFCLSILTFLILAQYFFRELYLGQINVILTMLLLVMTWCLKAGDQVRAVPKDVYAGCLWAVAVVLKPHVLIFLPYFLVQRKWYTLIIGLACLGLALLAPIPIYGFDGNIMLHQAWAGALLQSTPGLLAHKNMISLPAFFIKWTGNEALSIWLSTAATAGLAILMLLIVLKGRGIRHPVVLDSAILLALIPLLSPLGWYNVLLMAVLGITLLLRYYTEFTPFWRFVLVVNFCVMAFSFKDLMGGTLHKQFMNWSIITLNGLMLVAYLAWLRFKRIC